MTKDKVLKMAKQLRIISSMILGGEKIAPFSECYLMEQVADYLEALEHPAQEPKCSEHPDAPHGFCRNASHSAGRYVCECESWEAEHPAQEPVAWNEEEFNVIAYAYRTCPAHEVKMVSDRYQELINYVLSITHPAPSWQGLSNDRIREIGDNCLENNNGLFNWIDFARAIEQALKEKNHG